jgi:hypothetical protein
MQTLRDKMILSWSQRHWTIANRAPLTVQTFPMPQARRQIFALQ